MHPRMHETPPRHFLVTKPHRQNQVVLHMPACLWCVYTKMGMYLTNHHDHKPAMQHNHIQHNYNQQC